MREPLSEQNRIFFDGGNETESYLAKATHRRRIEIMRRVVQKETERLRKTATVTVLDVGCSSGMSTQNLVSNLASARIYGLDLSLKAMQAAKTRGILGIIADVASGVPICGLAFDIIIAGDIIEHLIETDFFLSEMRRCLKRSGLLILSTPNLARFVDRVRFIFGFAPKQCTPNHRYLKYHVTPFTLKTLRHSLKRNGFNIEVVASTFVHLDVTMRTDAKSRFLARLFPSLGSSLIVSARPT
jgi:2-polyprenyl-3-methyl-5-hydroxy-6-metoxy-1,4-benzoquinol methylase